MRFLVFIWAAMLVWISGCSYVQPNMSMFEDERIRSVTVRSYDASYDETWNALIAALDQRDELVAEEVRGEGFLMTEWVIRKRSMNWLPGRGSTRYRYRVRLQEVDEGRSQVFVRVDNESYHGDGAWGLSHPSDKMAKILIRALDEQVLWKRSAPDS